MSLPIIRPDWSAPKQITAFTTTIAGGKSMAPYHSLNFGLHVGDNPAHVNQNRSRLSQTLGNPHCVYLNQTHGDHITYLDKTINHTPNADACITDQSHVACIIMTADCLPVLICNQQGNKVAALHCGWKGLAKNLIRKTLTKHFVPSECFIWFGPAIDQKSYEVDEPIFKQFTQINQCYEQAFRPSRTNHYFFSLTAIAKQQCLDLGVPSQQITNCELDTFTDERFFSYRRACKTGRIASVIMIN